MSKQKLITFSEPKSPAAEAFRTLRTNITFSATDKPIKTLMVTSSIPGEGKSTIISNVAISLAQAGQKVLLVDCDMRRPSLQKILGLTNKTGLTNIMVEDAPFDEVIQSGWVEGLKVITTGPLPPNPAELIGSHKMKALIENLKSKADIILFDAPPVIAVTDAQLLASKLDGVILVVRSGSVSKDLVQKSKELLNNVNGHIVGTVLNRAEYEDKSHYYYYN